MWLHGGVIHKAGVKLCLEYLMRISECFINIAVLTCDRGVSLRQAFAQIGHDGVAGDVIFIAVLPSDVYFLERLIRLPPVSSKYRDPVITGHYMLHARHRLGGTIIMTLQETAEYRALQNRRMQHAG